MKKIISTTIIISVLLILTSCSSFSNDKKIMDTKIYEGTEGIVVELMQNAPPAEVFENQDFQIVGKVINKGAADVGYGYMKITIEPDYMSLIDPTNGEARVELDGKTMYDPSEKLKVENFYLKSKSIESMSEKHDSQILISTCYDYKTRLSATICIDPDTYGLNSVQKVCEIGSQSFSSQGAPVAVIGLEQKTLVTLGKLRPQFFITVTNAGGGQILTEGKSEEACSSKQLTRDDFNNIEITKIRMSDYTEDDFECHPKTLKFEQSAENKFVCTLNTTRSQLTVENNAFLTDFSVELSYGYMITQSKTVTIKRVNS